MTGSALASARWVSSCMVIELVCSQLAQGQGKAAVDQLAPDRVVPARRQLDAALEPAVGNLEPMDHRPARVPAWAARRVTISVPCSTTTSSCSLPTPGSATRSRVPLRSPAGRPAAPRWAAALRAARHEELTVQALGAVQEFAGFGPHPGAGVTWRHRWPFAWGRRPRRPRAAIAWQWCAAVRPRLLSMSLTLTQIQPRRKRCRVRPSATARLTKAPRSRRTSCARRARARRALRSGFVRLAGGRKDRDGTWADRVLPRHAQTRSAAP